jgi:hypothetical protein
MKSRAPFFLALGFLILALIITFHTFTQRDQLSAQVFPATINRDCAPWDGSAFTISIHYDPTTTITVSIWRAPEINIPTTVAFSDDTGQIGYAYILPELDPLQQLSGTVFLWQVDDEDPVEGRFDLVTEAGYRFEGQFHAEWGDFVALCG